MRVRTSQALRKWCLALGKQDRDVSCPNHDSLHGEVSASTYRSAAIWQEWEEEDSLSRGKSKRDWENTANGAKSFVLCSPSASSSAGRVLKKVTCVLKV